MGKEDQEAKRLAWQEYCRTGELPKDRRLRRWCERLARANAQFDRLHVVAENHKESDQ